MEKKILLIDDSPTQLISLKTSFSKLSYEIITAKDGAEGIFKAYEVLPDLIIADIIMPEINGYQLCRLLKNDDLTKDIPIILVTSLNEKLDRFWGLKAGADAFLTKDRDIDKLIDTAENLLNKTSYDSDEARQKQVQESKFLTATSIQTKIKLILDQSLIETTLMNEFRKLSEFVLTSTLLKEEVLTLLASVLDYNVAGIFFNDKDEKNDRILGFELAGVGEDKSFLEELTKKFFEEIFLSEYLKNPESYKYEIVKRVDTTKNQSSVALSDFASAFSIPIIYDDKILGGICLYSYEKDKFRPSKLLKIILEELKILMRIKWLYSETKYLTITDSLTGLYNRRYFQQALGREFARAKRYNLPLSIVMFDIDHFKNVNDTYGHQFGDKVIAGIAKQIKDSLRRTDYICRYGGEEFVLILPETTSSNAVIPIERIREKIESNCFSCYNEDITVTISAGIACIELKMTTEAELIKRADESLYKAKENGRNRVEVA